jgi:hypothetical protein
MTTILSERGEAAFNAKSGGDDLWLTAADAEAATGWSLKPEGLCRGEVCVPVPAENAVTFVRGDNVNLAAFWRHLGKPSVRSNDGEVWVLGESADTRAAAMRTLRAPDFTLPDLAGQPHTLSDHLGSKVLLATWASW